MGSNGRLEALITVPIGGWDLSVDGDLAVILAGNYYWDTLMAEIETRTGLELALSRGESGTGRMTISSGANFAITWIDLELRDLLGFTANLSGDDSYLAPQHARALWIGTCPYNAPNDIHPWVGWPEADYRSVESANGQVWAFSGQAKQVASLTWEAIRRARASRANESIVGESFQRFLEDGIWGFAPWGTPGGPVRFFPNADATAWVSYYVTELREFKPEQFADGWAGGPWRCHLPRLVFSSASAGGGGDPGPGDPPPPVGECQTLFVDDGFPPVEFPGTDGDLYLDNETGVLYRFEE